MSRVECVCCHRVERWDGEEVTVLMDGGGRSPSGDPKVAALIGALSAIQQGMRIVGWCGVCQQPQRSQDAQLPWVTVEAETPMGTLRVEDGRLHGTSESIADVLTSLEEAQRPTIREEFAGVGILPIVVLVVVPPFLLWLAAWGFLWTFYSILLGPDAPPVYFPQPTR